MNPFQGTYGGDNTDIFVSRFDTSGALQNSTYYGGIGSEGANAVCVDNAGSSYIAGYATADFPVYNAQYPTFRGGGVSGNSDGCVMKFDSAHQRQWASTANLYRTPLR